MQRLAWPNDRGREPRRAGGRGTATAPSDLRAASPNSPRLPACKKSRRESPSHSRLWEPRIRSIECPWSAGKYVR